VPFSARSLVQVAATLGKCFGKVFRKVFRLSVRRDGPLELGLAWTQSCEQLCDGSG
jgi:hypothetical protein